MPAWKPESDFKLTTDTPYLGLTGELWGVYYENFEEYWPRYNGTALYLYQLPWWSVYHLSLDIA